MGYLAAYALEPSFEDRETGRRLSKTIDMIINAQLDGLITDKSVCQLIVTVVNLQIKGGIVQK